MRISDWSSDVCSSDLLARDSIDVATRADRVNANNVMPLACQPSRRAPRCPDQLAVTKTRAVGQFDTARFGKHGRHLSTHQRPDIALDPKVCGSDQQAFETLGAAQVVL